MLILASQSPRRSGLLRQAGYPFQVEVSEAEEIADQAMDPADLVKENARRKAMAVYERTKAGCAVLGADTVVAFDGKIFGKPKDIADAKRMLQALSGRMHTVFTGVALVVKGEPYQAVEETKVYFTELDDLTIERYLFSGEPLGKAGAYAVQGMAGAFVRRIEGSFSNVIGLPLHLVGELAKKAGVDLYDGCYDGT